LSTLAIHPGALGDLVLFGRLLSCLPRPVTLVTGSQKGGLLVGLGAVDRALDFDALPIHEIFTDTPLGHCRLPSLLGTHDRLISCFATDNPPRQRRLAEAAGTKEAHFLPPRPPEQSTDHLLDIWCSRPGLDQPRGDANAWAVQPQWSRQAAEALKQVGVERNEPYNVIHPGAGSRQKCWPLKKALQLGRLLSADSTPLSAGSVVFVLGPVEREQWPAPEIEAVQRSFPVLLSPALSALAGLLAGARAFVGNDSGVSHLAAAVGTPTVAMFGPTQPRHFAPRGPRVRIVAAGKLGDISALNVIEAIAVVLPS
jgi:hypothetical protein